MKITMSVAALIAVVCLIPTVVSAQLTPRERQRAEEVARIQAKADAEERSRQRRVRNEMGQAICRSNNRVWDYANSVCEPKRRPAR